MVETLTVIESLLGTPEGLVGMALGQWIAVMPSDDGALDVVAKLAEANLMMMSRLLAAGVAHGASPASVEQASLGVQAARQIVDAVESARSISPESRGSMLRAVLIATMRPFVETEEFKQMIGEDSQFRQAVEAGLASASDKKA